MSLNLPVTPGPVARITVLPGKKGGGILCMKKFDGKYETPRMNAVGDNTGGLSDEELSEVAGGTTCTGGGAPGNPSAETCETGSGTRICSMGEATSGTCREGQSTGGNCESGSAPGSCVGGSGTATQPADSWP